MSCKFPSVHYFVCTFSLELSLFFFDVFRSADRLVIIHLANTSYTGASTPNRVHYPPSPLMPHAQPHGDAYTTIPLQDDYNNAPASGSATPHSGSMNKRKWSFLPGNRSSASLEKSAVDEKGAKRRPKNQRGTSWDLLGDRGEWEEFSPKNSSVENLRFAEGDVGTNKVSCYK